MLFVLTFLWIWQDFSALSYSIRLFLKWWIMRPYEILKFHLDLFSGRYPTKPVHTLPHLNSYRTHSFSPQNITHELFLTLAHSNKMRTIPQDQKTIPSILSTKILYDPWLDLKSCKCFFGRIALNRAIHYDTLSGFLVLLLRSPLPVLDTA